MNALKLIAAAWLAGVVVTYVVVSRGLNREARRQFRSTRLWLTLTWPVGLGYVAGWTLSYYWHRLRETRVKSAARTDNGS